MEKEQLEKKVQWLDEERRQAIDALADFERRLFSLEELQKEGKSRNATNYAKEIEQLKDQVVDLEARLKKQNTEIKKEFQGFEKQQKKQEKDLEQDQKGINKVLEDFRKETGQLQAIQKTLNTHEHTLAEGRIGSLEESIRTVLKGEERRSQLAKNLEESSKQDARRLTQLHTQVSDLLPRLEEAAKKTEGILLAQRKVEKRMDELALAEEEQQTDHARSLEKEALAMNERAKQWKEWEKRFELMEQHTNEVAARLKDIETTDLAVKRAQRSFDELIEKINRRVNELGEMQRLGDQRFRQEWSTFQADAQKRLASFSLNKEEQQREAAREQGKLSEQLTQLQDGLSEVSDAVQHLREQAEHQLQSLLEMARDSLAEHERFLNNSR